MIPEQRDDRIEAGSSAALAHGAVPSGQPLRLGVHGGDAISHPARQ